MDNNYYYGNYTIYNAPVDILLCKAYNLRIYVSYIWSLAEILPLSGFPKRDLLQVIFLLTSCFSEINKCFQINTESSGIAQKNSSFLRVSEYVSLYCLLRRVTTLRIIYYQELFYLQRFPHITRKSLPPPPFPHRKLRRAAIPRIAESGKS